jgi:hypothetical protein
MTTNPNYTVKGILEAYAKDATDLDLVQYCSDRFTMKSRILKSLPDEELSVKDREQIRILSAVVKELTTLATYL